MREGGFDKGLKLGDGQYISYDEMMEYLEDSGVKKYPGIDELKVDLSLVGVAKAAYLYLSRIERLREAQRRGKKLVAKWSAVPTDPYYGAGVIPIDPYLTAMVGEVLLGKNTSLCHEGRKQLGPEACGFQAAAHSASLKDILPLDAFYPLSGPWCNATFFNAEALRDHLPLVGFLDQPYFGSMQGKGKNALEYSKKELQEFFSAMEGLTGQKVTEEMLRESIKIHNQLRHRCRQLSSYLTLDTVPMGSLDFLLLGFMCTDWQADPVAALDALDTLCVEMEQRVRRGEKGKGLADDPVRVFFGGITASDFSIYSTVDQLGGVTVGLE